MPARLIGYQQGELDRLMWADSFTIDLNGLSYQLQGTSAEFVRSAARLVRLPPAMTKPDVVFSAVFGPIDTDETPVLSLYVGPKPALRTISSEFLLHAFLSELRGRALAAAGDRVFLKMPTVRLLGASVLLPSFVLRHLDGFERAAAHARVEFVASPAVTIDLKTGRPVPGFTFNGEQRNTSNIVSIDAIAVQKTPEGGLPSRAEVLHEISENCPNLGCLGGKGLNALRLLVERARLIEWNEARPDLMIERLAQEPLRPAG